MRLLLVAFLLTIGACRPLATSARAGAFSTPKALAQHAFESLRAGDEYAWERALATDAEFEDLVTRMGGEKTALALRLKEERNEAAIAFRSIRESVGTWECAKLETIDTPVGTSGAVDGSDVTIIFGCGERRFVVRLDDCMKAQRGWIIGGTPRLERR